MNPMDVDLNWRDARGVEGYAERCGCGGDFTLNAPPRCPHCRSVDLMLDITVNGVHYEEFYD